MTQAVQEVESGARATGNQMESGPDKKDAVSPVVGGLKANREGRSQAITVMTPMRPSGLLPLELLFWLINHDKELTAPLRKLSFIHFAHWSIIREFPYNGGPQPREKLHSPYLLFVTNFNGTWDQYIDAFAYTVRDQMNKIWQSSYGFPGPYPVQPFKDYIRFNEFVCSHYYSAYPDATTTVILHAIELEKRFADLLARAETLDPIAFKTAYEEFLTDVQHLL